MTASGRRFVVRLPLSSVGGNCSERRDPCVSHGWREREISSMIFEIPFADLLLLDILTPDDLTHLGHSMDETTVPRGEYLSPRASLVVFRLLQCRLVRTAKFVRTRTTSPHPIIRAQSVSVRIRTTRTSRAHIASRHGEREREHGDVSGRR